MPFYKHICKKCNIEKVDLFKINDPEPVCKICSNKMERIIQASGLKFISGKSGWSTNNYTDIKRK